MIGIFGGTFDPVHYGHIKPALAVKAALGLTELRFIPNRIPPHREPPWLNAAQRLHLLQLAVAGMDGVRVDERELRRDGPSYMVDTLESIHRERPEEGLCLIMGMDALQNIDSWYHWHHLFDHAMLVVTHRPGYDPDQVLQGFSPGTADDIRSRLVFGDDAPGLNAIGKILIQSVPQLDISSTMIRQGLERGMDISNFVPDAVEQQLKRYNQAPDQ